MSIDLQLRELKNIWSVLYKKKKKTDFETHLENEIIEAFKTIEKLNEENIILKKLLYKIRSESKKCILSNQEVFGQYYRPIRNTTKQEVYNSYQEIKDMILSDYEFICNEKAINMLIEEKRSN